jgi:hypothetical protein
VLLAAAPAARAAEVRFPLTVDWATLGAALRRHLDAQGRGGLELWRRADGCGSFALREPVVEPLGARLKISGPATGEAGLALFGSCWASVGWRGRAEILARPEVGPDWQLRLRDLETRLLDPTGQRRGVVPRLWPVVRGWAEAGLGSFALDLGPPVGELTALLGAFGGEAGAAPLARALSTLRPAGLSVEREAVTVVLVLDAPPAPPVVRGPEPALGPAELARWQARLEAWDGFLTFLVIQLAGEQPGPPTRDELLGVLLEARHDLVATLARGPERGTDAVRRSFLETRNRVRALVRRVAARPGADPGRAGRYVVFLAAGGALAAIDALAPALGLDFSADGLRRLARSLDPGFPGDPLQRGEGADPRLQELFRFRDPDAPPRRRRGGPPGTSWRWPGPRPAWADEHDGWRAVGARLAGWVPAPDELARYRELVDRLLSLAAERSLDPDRLEERFDDLYRALVKATAWQESCWRQFVRREGRVVPIESSTGDVGLMQVNLRVWRGFFDARRLRGDAGYNAGAGAEILHQLLLRYGRREARERLDDAARATYAAYHRGPAQYRSYCTAAPTSRAAAVFRAFWHKYQAVAAGRAGDRVLCLPGPLLSRAPGVPRGGSTDLPRAS